MDRPPVEHQSHLETFVAAWVLQQRTLLGLIAEGDGSVDLGALLKRLDATLTGPTKAQAGVALTAYNAAVVAYARDGELADVSARCRDLSAATAVRPPS